MKLYHAKRPGAHRATALLCALLMGLSPALPAVAQHQQTVSVAEITPQAEAAIDKGLEYLARSQGRDGAWGGSAHQAGVTAVGLMAFMLKGHFPGHGRYGDRLDKAVDYLIAKSREGGGYYGGSMYEQGLATLALSEAWGMSDREELRNTLKQNVQIILRAQHPNGGWRYKPLPIDHDLSVTVMVLVALVSAQEAGIMVPRDAIDRAVAYIHSCQNPTGGFGYRPGDRSDRFARSAGAAMVLHLLGQSRSPQAQRSLQFLLDAGDKIFSNTDFYYYAHYYAIQTMYQKGDAYYQQWYPQISSALLDRQRDDGRWSGGRGGDDYSTAMAILVLGVPYRFLPIYQR